MPQHYIKIEIKGESDLPKEVGRYETCCKGDLRYVYWEGTPDDKDYWMLNVDYYFLPVPEPQQPEQTRIERHELEIKLVGIIKEKLNMSNYVPGVVEASKEIAELFASQSHNNTVIGPSDSDLEKAFPTTDEALMKQENITYLSFDAKNLLGYLRKFNQYKQQGAKYALSQCKAVNLKDVLKDFNSFMCKNQYDGQIPMIDQCIDDYLKSPENK